MMKRTSGCSRAFNCRILGRAALASKAPTGMVFVLCLCVTGATGTNAQTPPLLSTYTPPVVFEKNEGQAPEQVKWLARGPGYTLALANDGLAMMLMSRRSAPSSSSSRRPAEQNVIHLALEGSRPWNNMAGLDPTGGVSNYMVPGNHGASLNDIRHYGRVRAAEVYPGIDMVFHNSSGNLEFDFVLRPGADPQQIHLVFQGQRDIRVDDGSGDLVLTTKTGAELRQRRPRIYQVIKNKQREVAGEYQVLAGGRAAFTLGEYDHSRQLVIDPTVQVWKFIGDASKGNAVAVDGGGNAYVTGVTSGIPVTDGSELTTGVKDPSFWDGVVYILTHLPPYGFTAKPVVPYLNSFVMKISPLGNILFASYIGLGNGKAIAVDSTGVVLTGYFEQDPNSNITNGSGVFVLKLSVTGHVLYSSVLNGMRVSMAAGVALDSQHNAWVTGQTADPAFTHRPAGSPPDVLLFKVNPQGTVVFTKIFGGTGADAGIGIATDRADNVSVTGRTCSADFPASPHLGLINGPCASFVTKLLAQSNATRITAVFGGGDRDIGLGIAVDANGIAYVAGTTTNLHFPTSSNAYQQQPSGSYSQGYIMQWDDAGDSSFDFVGKQWRYCAGFGGRQRRWRSIR